MYPRTSTGSQSKAGPAGRSVTRWTAMFAAAAALSAIFAMAQQPQQPSIDKPVLLPEANRLPDRNEQMILREQQAKKDDFEAANLERKKQISDDAAKLLEMAKDLKSEVDKTNKDTLSLNVIRKAESIERLAKGVREKMKLTVGAS